MTNPMLADLDEVVRLMDSATPGLLQPEFGEAYNVRAAHGGIFAQIHNLKGRHGMGGRVDGNEAANNARLIAQAINFLRTHHATLADMAKRLEAAERDAAVIREVVGSWRVLERVSGNSFERNAFKLCADQINAATQEGEG